MGLCRAVVLLHRRLCGSRRGLQTTLAWLPPPGGIASAISRLRKVLDVSKRTFQPNNRRRAKTHGFRVRMRTRAGRAIIAARRRKGRSELSA